MCVFHTINTAGEEIHVRISAGSPQGPVFNPGPDSQSVPVWVHSEAFRMECPKVRSGVLGHASFPQRPAPAQFEQYQNEDEARQQGG